MKYLLLVYGLTAKKLLFFLVFLLGFSAQPVWAATAVIQAKLSIFDMTSMNDANVDLFVSGRSNGELFTDINPIDGNVYFLSKPGDTLKVTATLDTFSGPLGTIADTGSIDLNIRLRFDVIFDPIFPTIDIPAARSTVGFDGSGHGVDFNFFGLGSIVLPINDIQSAICSFDAFSPDTSCRRTVIRDIVRRAHPGSVIDPLINMALVDLSISQRAKQSEVHSAGFIEFTVPAVPIPAAAWLFGSGLIGLIGFARRKA